MQNRVVEHPNHEDRFEAFSLSTIDNVEILPMVLVCVCINRGYSYVY